MGPCEQETQAKQTAVELPPYEIPLCAVSFPILHVPFLSVYSIPSPHACLQTEPCKPTCLCPTGLYASLLCTISEVKWWAALLLAFFLGLPPLERYHFWKTWFLLPAPLQCAFIPIGITSGREWKLLSPCAVWFVPEVYFGLFVNVCLC